MNNLTSNKRAPPRLVFGMIAIVKAELTVSNKFNTRYSLPKITTGKQDNCQKVLFTSFTYFVLIKIYAIPER